jgi:hypothetical protein
MEIEPYPSDVACAGPKAPKCEQIDDLIKLLVTIRERWGNTAVKYRVTWGGNALWVEDEHKRTIAELVAACEYAAGSFAQVDGTKTVPPIVLHDCRRKLEEAVKKAKENE